MARFSLIPKEEQYFNLFRQMTSHIYDAASKLAEMLAGKPADFQTHLDSIKAIEHQCDELTHSISTKLNSSFITPFDREDIRSIATDLDDVLDELESVAQYLVLFGLSDAPEGLCQFARILTEMASEIHRLTGLIWDLSNEKQIQAGIVRISDLENQADQLYNTVIADLFREDGRPPIRILKWKEVYQGLEDACDHCRDYSHVIGNLLVKNS